MPRLKRIPSANAVELVTLTHKKGGTMTEKPFSLDHYRAVVEEQRDYCADLYVLAGTIDNEVWYQVEVN